MPHVYCVEPTREAVIWRFMNLYKFRDLVSSEELYFRRADLFEDKSEGLPPEQYAAQVLGLNAYDINDCRDLNHHLGFLAQHRESYYIQCWHLYRQETLDMWEQYGDDGVAVCSCYGLLRSALNGLLDETHAAVVQYGTDHLANTYNTLQFLTTKQSQYSQDRELRALLVGRDPLSAGNRHFDLNGFPSPAPLAQNPRHSWVPEYKRRRIDLRALVTGVVTSPWAEEHVVDEVKLWMHLKGLSAEVSRSELSSAQTPTLEEFRNVSHIAGGRIPEPEVTKRCSVEQEDLDRFAKVLSGLPLSQVRSLYRERWDVCRLKSESLPPVMDAQYLETILRVLHARHSE